MLIEIRLGHFHLGMESCAIIETQIRADRETDSVNSTESMDSVDSTISTNLVDPVDFFLIWFCFDPFFS